MVAFVCLYVCLFPFDVITSSTVRVETCPSSLVKICMYWHLMCTFPQLECSLSMCRLSLSFLQSVCVR